ncbi:MAG: hypothetical protein COZ38_12245 [Rhodocyclales bacterium CG_4_10_14_3_um_filter_68_10]|nr:MAG: hypothetical protein COZ38_12245 [Rhodocyclales bacterium CG_4_10_14_3_um_filter_68_10]
MHAIFYREHKAGGEARVEDVLCFTDGVGRLQRACAPGSAQAQADQAAFFGARAIAPQKVDETRFEAMVSKALPH